MELIKAFRKKRLAKYWSGAVLFWGGIFLTFSDMLTNFPTPQHGVFGLRWLALAIPGAILIFLSKKLPIEETLQVAEKCNFVLTPAVLSKELGIPVDLAEKTLAYMVKKGCARHDYDTKNMVQVYSFAQLKGQIESSSSGADTFLSGSSALDSPEAPPESDSERTRRTRNQETQ